MKPTFIKFFTLAIAMVMGVNSSIYGNNDSDRKCQMEIILKKANKGFNTDRSIGADAMATYYIDMGYIELLCNDTKETSVYIVNSKGEEISYDSFDAGMNPYYMMDVPQTPGTYYIIIDSPVLYAEGAFVVE